MSKSVDAFRTIGEVADELDVPKHVLRFWEGKFPHIRPMKRGGGRRYYRPEDMELLRGIRHLLHAEGYTIKGVQKILREQGIDQVKEAAAAATAVRAAEARSAKSRGRTSRRAASASAAGGLETATPPMAERSRNAASADDANGKPQSVSKRTGKDDVIASAIHELDICLQILSGKIEPQAAAAQRPGPKLRASRS